MKTATRASPPLIRVQPPGPFAANRRESVLAQHAQCIEGTIAPCHPGESVADGCMVEPIDKLADVSESNLEELPGMGPTAIADLRAALDEHGLSFRCWR